MIEIKTIFGTEVDNIHTVVYQKDGTYFTQETNALSLLSDQWNDVRWLRNFFKTYKSDYEAFYGPLDLNYAVKRTIREGSKLLEFLSKEENADIFHEYFKPYHNNDGLNIYELQALKLPGDETRSWIRIYALRYEDKFVITGGAIKLTKTTNTRDHLKDEFLKLRLVKDFIMTSN